MLFGTATGLLSSSARKGGIITSAVRVKKTAGQFLLLEPIEQKKPSGCKYLNYCPLLYFFKCDSYCILITYESMLQI